jgi:hypothetical protein
MSRFQMGWRAYRRVECRPSLDMLHDVMGEFTE